MVLSSTAVALLCLATPASAQLSRVGAVVRSLEPGGVMRGTDTAYDPEHGVFLVVVGNGPVYGVFVNSAGAAITAPFGIMINDGSNWSHFPRVEYSRDVPNGAGGVGGFLVTWNQNIGNTNYVFGRVVSFRMPGGVVTGTQQISDGEQRGTWHETGPAMAYSASSGRFLVAWRTLEYGIRGRFVDTNGVPSGAIFQLENTGGSRDPALTWNPATNEFGLASTGFGGSGAFAAFRRIRASDGFVSGRTSFGFAASTFATAIDVNSASQYVMTWAVHPGTNSATFDPHGNLLATSFITDRLGFDQSLGLAYNSASGTFLAVSSDRDSAEVGAVEIAGNGLPNSVAQVVTDGGIVGGGSFHPLAAALPGTHRWNVVYSQNFRGATHQFVATSTTGGGSGTLPPPPTGGGSGSPTSGCSTPDPFASIGGGTCVNGGWLPGGGGTSAPPPPAPPPPPPPTGAACSGADPFASIGGGTCINGGWVPGRSGASAPPPSAPPPPAPAPRPPTGAGCSGSDPFAAIGGGSCVNGGWVPGGSGATGGSGVSTSGCSGADPFATTGGGACVNGGWVPQSLACTGPDPFVSIGGGVCINKGWVPR